MPTGTSVDQNDRILLQNLSAGVLNAYLVPPMDVSNYGWMSLFIDANAYIGTLAFLQGPTISGPWVPCTLYRLGNLDGRYSTDGETSETSVYFGGPVRGDFFAVQMSGYTSGTATGSFVLKKQGPSSLLLTNNITQLSIVDYNLRTQGMAVHPDGSLTEQSRIWGGVLNAQGYIGTTGNVSTSGAATDAAFSLYTDATNTHDILIYDIKFFGGNGTSTHELRTSTSNLALTAATVSNLKLGGASTSLSGSTGSVTYSSSTQTVAGTALDAFVSPANAVYSPFESDTILYLPAGFSRSVTLYLNIAGAGNWAATFKWLEF